MGLNLCVSIWLLSVFVCLTTHSQPSGQGSQEGRMIVYTNDNSNDFAQWSGQGHHQHRANLGSGRFPTGGIPWSSCWGFSGACGCYNNDGCVPVLPVGTGGRGSHPCPRC